MIKSGFNVKKRNLNKILRGKKETLKFLNIHFLMIISLENIFRCYFITPFYLARNAFIRLCSYQNLFLNIIFTLSYVLASNLISESIIKL